MSSSARPTSQIRTEMMAATAALQQAVAASASQPDDISHDPSSTHTSTSISSSISTPWSQEINARINAAANIDMNTSSNTSSADATGASKLSHTSSPTSSSLPQTLIVLSEELRTAQQARDNNYIASLKASNRQPNSTPTYTPPSRNVVLQASLGTAKLEEMKNIIENKSFDYFALEPLDWTKHDDETIVIQLIHSNQQADELTTILLEQEEEKKKLEEEWKQREEDLRYNLKQQSSYISLLEAALYRAGLESVLNEIKKNNKSLANQASRTTNHFNKSQAIDSLHQFLNESDSSSTPLPTQSISHEPSSTVKLSSPHSTVTKKSTGIDTQKSSTDKILIPRHIYKSQLLENQLATAATADTTLITPSNSSISSTSSSSFSTNQHAQVIETQTEVGDTDYQPTGRSLAEDAGITFVGVSSQESDELKADIPSKKYATQSEQTSSLGFNTEENETKVSSQEEQKFLHPDPNIEFDDDDDDDCVSIS